MRAALQQLPSDVQVHCVSLIAHTHIRLHICTITSMLYPIFQLDFYYIMSIYGRLLELLYPFVASDIPLKTVCARSLSLLNDSITILYTAARMTSWSPFVFCLVPIYQAQAMLPILTQPYTSNPSSCQSSLMRLAAMWCISTAVSGMY